MTVRIGPIASERDGGTAERLAGATWNNAKDRPNPRDDPRGVGLRNGDDLHGECYGAGEVVTLPASASGYDYSSGAFGDNGATFAGAAPAGYAGGAAYCPPQPAYGPACEPEDTHWWKKHRLCVGPGLLKPPRGSFFRMEYLLWEIEEPGSVLLGADPPKEFSGVSDFDFDSSVDPNAIFDTDFDPSNGFFQFDPNTGLFGFAYVPRLDEIQLRDNSGLRLTLGIPTYDYGTIELSGWMLEQASDHYRFFNRAFIPAFGAGFGGIPFNPATTVKVDGVAGLSALNYSEFLDVEYRSDLWGADAKYVVDSLSPPGEGLKFKPLFGVKYVGLQESMYQKGLFQPTFGESIASSINSDTSNTIFGGTIGLRTELVHRWFTLGLQPAVTFAGNVSQARVSTERFLDNADPRQEVTSDYFDFCPILDLNAYARICLSENLRLTVGYDAFWLARVYRAARVIDYNVSTDGGTTFRTDFQTQRRADHVAVEGLSLGLEYIF